MAVVLWLLLGLAYAWSVRNLARMSRPPAERRLASSADRPRMKVVDPDERTTSVPPTRASVGRS